jgi:predicted dehydrogenase
MVALVDVNKDNLAGALKDSPWTGDMCFTSLNDALKKIKADAAVVVTPPKFHREPVIACLEAGLNVISEKPMAEDLADCKAMVKAARDTKKLYVISQNYRYNRPMTTLAKIICSGKLGAVGQVKLDFYLGIDFKGFREEMPYPLIIDMSIHHLDLIRYITGLDPVAVTASSWNPKWSHYKHDCSSTALFEMSNGARILYNGSWCCKGSFSDWNGNWQIECEKGTVTYQNGEIKVLEVPEGYDAKNTIVPPLEEMKLQQQAYVLDELMRCVKSGKMPATNCYDNLKSVSMVFATVKAMETGRRVPVLDAGTKRLLSGL